MELKYDEFKGEGSDGGDEEWECFETRGGSRVHGRGTKKELSSEERPISGGLSSFGANTMKR